MHDWLTKPYTVLMEARIETTRSVTLDELNPDTSTDALAAARELLLEYGHFVVSRPGAAQFCFGSLEKEVEQLPFSFIHLGGGSFLARVDGLPAGFIAWRQIPPAVEPDAWEMKRLWVRPIARGLGLGKLLTENVIERARAAHRTAIYLDTVPETMASAYRMYLDLGFLVCPPYNDNAMDGVTFMRKPLR